MAAVIQVIEGLSQFLSDPRKENRPILLQAVSHLRGKSLLLPNELLTSLQVLLLDEVLLLNSLLDFDFHLLVVNSVLHGVNQPLLGTF